MKSHSWSCSSPSPLLEELFSFHQEKQYYTRLRCNNSPFSPKQTYSTRAPKGSAWLQMSSNQCFFALLSERARLICEQTGHLTVSPPNQLCQHSSNEKQPQNVIKYFNLLDISGVWIPVIAYDCIQPLSWKAMETDATCVKRAWAIVKGVFKTFTPTHHPLFLYRNLTCTSIFLKLLLLLLLLLLFEIWAPDNLFFKMTPYLHSFCCSNASSTFNRL